MQESKNGKDDEIQASREDSGEDVNFAFSGGDSDEDEEEARSEISNNVSLMEKKYHVRASVSSILQSIINRYGDIAATCKLESNSMKAYYLECLCSVVQDLQSTPLLQMTKAKVKEMLSVLKDVESAQIHVDWLRNIINEISEAIDLSTQYQTIDAAKASFGNILESTREELESQMRELAFKEKEVTDLQERVAEIKSQLSNLEVESNQLGQSMQVTESKVKKFSGKSLADEIL